MIFFRIYGRNITVCDITRKHRWPNPNCKVMSLHVKYFVTTLAVHSPFWRQWASLYRLQPEPLPALVLNSTSVTVATGSLSQDSPVPSSSLYLMQCRPLSEHDWHSCLCVERKGKKRKKKRCCCLPLRAAGLTWLWHMQYSHFCVNCQTIMTAVFAGVDEWGWKAEATVIDGPVKCQQPWGQHDDVAIEKFQAFVL